MSNDTQMHGNTTAGKDYTSSLLNRQSVWWKRWLDVQAPYRWHVNHLQPGFVLDVGCGIGRNLLHLKGHGIGVDHNISSVTLCRQRGLIAFTLAEFETSGYNMAGRFDSILLAHVAEHMTRWELSKLIKQYLHLLKPGGRFIIITPQEAGYQSDNTHVEFMDFSKIEAVLNDFDLPIYKQYSFPFPRLVGKFFKYNEFVTVALKQA